jgi:hypothetical protein
LAVTRASWSEATTDGARRVVMSWIVLPAPVKLIQATTLAATVVVATTPKAANSLWRKPSRTVEVFRAAMDCGAPRLGAAGRFGFHSDESTVLSRSAAITIRLAVSWSCR